MTAAEQEAAFVAASDSFKTDPAGIINGYALRAASKRADDPWRANDEVRHLVQVGLLLAAAAGLDPGHSLNELSQTYGGGL